MGSSCCLSLASVENLCWQSLGFLQVLFVFISEIPTVFAGSSWQERLSCVMSTERLASSSVLFSKFTFALTGETTGQWLLAPIVLMWVLWPAILPLAFIHESPKNWWGFFGAGPVILFFTFQAYLIVSGFLPFLSQSVTLHIRRQLDTTTRSCLAQQTSSSS